MKKNLTLLICFIFPLLLNARIRTIHVYVALCDNIHQGIVPVPAKLGNGKDPSRNLYWGAMYGVKSYFSNQSEEWEMLKIVPSGSDMILESILFRHRKEDVFLLAEAYDGAEIRECVRDFLSSSNYQQQKTLVYDTDTLKFAGDANLVVYVGHDGLMEFSADLNYLNPGTKPGSKEAIVLACSSEEYFLPELKQSGASAILLTTGLMAPEAYTLEAAINGWVLNETNEQIKERAAQAYHRYQHCGIKGARNLFTFSP